MDDKTYGSILDKLKQKVDYELYQLSIQRNMSTSDVKVAGGNESDIERLHSDFSGYLTDRISKKFGDKNNG